MKVAFFIGHHKTGSTSLQTYLASHYAELLNEGVLYPAVEAEGISFDLALVQARRGPAGPDLRMNIREPHNALAFRLLNEAAKHPVPEWHPNLPTGFQMLHLIVSQMNAIRPEHVVLCSEVMSRFAERGGDKALARLVGRFGSHEVSIVLNLRRIDDYLASWHLQRLKFGAPVRPLRQGAQQDYANGVHFRYDTIVERWKSAFPAARLVVRNYDDVVAAGGSVADFFAQAGIAHTPVDDDTRANVSVPYALAEIVRLGNQRLPAMKRSLLTYVLDAARRIDYPRNSEVELFGSDLRQRLLADFRPVHDALCQHLGIETFFPDLETVGLCRPMPELEAAQQALAALRTDAAAHGASPDVVAFLNELDLTE